MELLIQSWLSGNFSLFPAVVIGPVIILIGLSLSPAAVNMAKENWLLAFISLITVIIVLTFGKGLVKLDQWSSASS